MICAMDGLQNAMENVITLQPQNYSHVLMVGEGGGGARWSQDCVARPYSGLQGSGQALIIVEPGRH